MKATVALGQDVSKINVCNTTIPKLWFSLGNATSDYDFLLPIPNAFSIDTEEGVLLKALQGNKCKVAIKLLS